MPAPIFIEPKVRPALDPGFIPASLWNRAYRERAAARGADLILALERGAGAVSVFRTHVLPEEGASVEINRRYAERLVKSLLYPGGGYKVIVGGPRGSRGIPQEGLRKGGSRAFDADLMGDGLTTSASIVEGHDGRRRPADQRAGRASRSAGISTAAG